jgi:hypothetical protein
VKPLRKLRGLFAWTLWLVLASTETVRFPEDFSARLAASGRFLTAPRNSTGVNPAGFWFDPDYASFLEAVRRATPEGATIAVVAPRTVDLYAYRAAYELAPRRVVEESEATKAQFVAVYRKAAIPGFPPGTPIENGTLLRR